jgi:hypothetical protein
MQPASRPPSFVAEAGSRRAGITQRLHTARWALASDHFDLVVDAALLEALVEPGRRRRAAVARGRPVQVRVPRRGGGWGGARQGIEQGQRSLVRSRVGGEGRLPKRPGER